MLNQFVICGRLTGTDIIMNNDGMKVESIMVSVPRPYKNENGEYEEDSIVCILSKEIASKVTEYVNCGDLIGIKGRIQNTNNEIELIVEKLSFLSSSKKED